MDGSMTHATANDGDGAMDSDDAYDPKSSDDDDEDDEEEEDDSDIERQVRL